jgi:beta-aspartyl-peptidase (threonine type)
MKILKRISILLMVFVLMLNINASSQDKTGERPFGIVIHGGAGDMKKESMPPEEQEAYRKKLEEALTAGYNILKDGGKSLDAVETAIRIMEDSPLFNAGKGAVFTAEGTNELDASIMEGKTLNAGAVAAVKRVKNPIALARMVMEHSPHVMLAGEGAEKFAKEMGLPPVSNKYFYTKSRWESLQKIKKRKKEEEKKKQKEKNKKFGTVGAAALDKEGNLAAGTSTGGMTYKRFGRIGDSPVIGAGTYANNRTCAVSCTGHGEYFMRTLAAYDISALMEYKGLSLADAAATVLKKLEDMGGSGGLIAMDGKGNITMPFNTGGMFRGFKINDGEMVIKIFKE